MGKRRLSSLTELSLALAFWLVFQGSLRCVEAESGMHALMIGINEYRHIEPLEGAVADARDLDNTLRDLGVTDRKVLLDGDADRTAVLRELASLVARTGPQDTVLIALSGRGALEPERVRGSQPQGKDCVFLLAEFDPSDQRRASEKLLQAEFNHFIKAFEAAGARVVLIADYGCGLGSSRVIDPRASEMRNRSTSYAPHGDQLKSASTRDDAFLTSKDFRHSIILSAAERELTVPEIRIPNAGFRGALSYAVGRAFEGAADLNGDGRLTDEEFISYLRQVTYQISDARQHIVVATPAGADLQEDVLIRFSRGVRVLPVGGAAADEAGNLQIEGVVLVPLQPEKFGPIVQIPASKAQAVNVPDLKEPIRVASLDGQASRVSGLKPTTPYEVVSPSSHPDLVWDPASHDVIAGNDTIARNVDRNDVPVIIDRMAALRWLKLRAAKAPQEMRVFPNDQLHRKGDQVEVSIRGIAGRSLILFNIASDGTLQFIYPLGSDPPVIGNTEHRMTLQVREPYGADEIVSISAPERQTELEQALKQLDRRRTPLKISQLVERFDQADLKVGVIGLYAAP
ncbi:MAG: caspase family protein [Alphaproteobacteria bacterium]|nr:caspase family protein [Alphaproteobacteria bacterium]